MLVLTRKINEIIVVGGHIEIKVLDSQDGKVRLGIGAPKDVRILRTELKERHDATDNRGD